MRNCGPARRSNWASRWGASSELASDGRASRLTAARRRVATTLPPQDVSLDKGEEFGRFNMGSTVILLFQENRVHWHDNLRAGATVKLGQPLGGLE